MKKLICAMLVAAASAAFADGDDDIAVIVSTKGPDTYLGGKDVVMDGECYALVWSSDGAFNGFSADGSALDPADRVVSVGPVARMRRTTKSSLLRCFEMHCHAFDKDLEEYQALKGGYHE